MSKPFTIIKPVINAKKHIHYAAVSDGKKMTYYINGYEVSKEVYEETFKTGVLK